MKHKWEIYKKRLALVLAIVLTFTGATPVRADSISNNTVTTASENTGEAVSSSDASSDTPAQDSDTGTGTAQAEVSPDAAEQTGGDSTVSGGLSENLSISENISANSVFGVQSTSTPVADATIMYYMVGSNLEGNGAEATKDIIEIMTGLQRAEAKAETVRNANINVIVETGGVSDKAMEAGGKHKKALDELNERLQPGKETASADDLQLLNTINGANNGSGIQWNKNERWVLSGTSIKSADNKVTDATRVMTGIKSTGKAPELTEFITTTARTYPAKNYMLVLWDHGGGPAGGFGGDDRGKDEDTYITADQLTRSLSDAKSEINKDTSVSYNKNFEKLAFLGFDACLMGNLETAMALEPYAKYLFASEDLEPGSGWDHRGYVEEMFYSNTASQLNQPNRGSLSYEPEAINSTVQDIGYKLVTDNIDYYNELKIQSTMSVISLNKTDFANLNDALGSLASDVINEMAANNKFNTTSYVKILEAAEEAIRFSDAGSGIVDLYSLCGKLGDKFGGGVKSSADAVKALIKPSSHDDLKMNDDLVAMQQYTNNYVGFDASFHALGGFTVFLPFQGNRFSTDDGETVDKLKDYLEIYKKVEDSPTLSAGYTSLMKAFCAAQALGKVVSDQFDEKPDAISAKMKEEEERIKTDYNLLAGNIIKMLDDMTDENGDAIKGRISSDDIHLKTVFTEVDEGQPKVMQHVIDFSGEKHSMIKNIRQEPVFVDDNGKKYRLGFLPAAYEEPGALQIGSTPTGEYRYTIENLKEQKWFFINNYPAAILSVKNLTTVSEQDYFNPFDENTKITVQFPANMKKGDSDYYSDVIIEVEFDTASMNNVVPTGYYSLDTNIKQLTGFVPWESLDEDTFFSPISDMGEFFDNAENSIDPDKTNEKSYTDWLEKEKVLFSRDKKLADGMPYQSSSMKFASFALDYTIKDIFGGMYQLDALKGGEAVTATITLSRNGYDGSVDFISQNTPDIYANLSFVTNSGEYSLSFNDAELPKVGYYDGGVFHKLAGSEDFAALEPGTYELTFEGYDKKEETFPVEGDTQLFVIDGGEVLPGVTVSASNYKFYTSDDNPTLTVGDKKSGLTIEPVGDARELPYGFYMTLDPFKDLKEFVTVKNGGGDVIASPYMNFTISANGNNYNMTEDTERQSFKNLKLEPGTIISVNASFIVEGETLYTKKPVELTIGRQSVKIYGTNPFNAYEFTDDNLFWKNDDYYTGEGSYSPSVNVVMHFNGKDYDDRVLEGLFVGEKGLTLDELISANHVSAVYINTTDTDGVGTYKDLYFGPDDGSGKKRPGSWEDEHFIEKFSTYLKVENDSDVKLQKYNIHPASNVSFRSLKDDTKLLEDRIVFFDENAQIDSNGRHTVSDESIKISDNPVKQWYLSIGTNKRVPVYLDGETIAYDDDGNNKTLVVSESNTNAWRFYLPAAASSNNVTFYADYEEAVSTLTETGKKTFDIKMAPVRPVEYTGKELVTTTSGKNGSRNIELVIKDAKGNVLTEGTDYTVSYKNNKNAAGPSAGKKAPTLIISGKGKTYKGLKATAQFTILPADLRYAQVAANRQFVPFTSGGKISVTTTLKLPSGVKIPENQLEVEYYDDGDKLTKEEIKQLYKGSEARNIEICVYAKAPKSGAKNYRIGSAAPAIYVTAYPKGSKSLALSLSKSKQAFEENKTYKVADIVESVLKKTSLKVGKTKVDASKLTGVKAYYDKNLVYPVAENGALIDRAGTYYLAFELNDEAARALKVYKPTVKKFQMTGKKLVKGKTKIDAKKSTISFNGSAQNVAVNVLIDMNKLKASEMLVTYTTRDGSTYEGTVGYAANEAKYGVKYDYTINNAGVLVLSDIDNGAKGSYTLTFKGMNDYTGSFKLTYKVK